jgi:hypothetical protein
LVLSLRQKIDKFDAQDFAHFYPPAIAFSFPAFFCLSEKQQNKKVHHLHNPGQRRN